MFGQINSLWLRIPWFVSAPLVVVLAAAAVAGTNYFTAPLFHETCHNERNLLTGEFEASNCGEGAKVAKGAESSLTPPAPTPVASGTPGATGTAPPSSGVLASGQFRDGDPGHSGKGTAEVQRLPDGKLNLFLRDFSVTNGPDLFVYLGEKGGRDEDGLTLGELQANNGNQNYAIPAGTDLTRYDRVIIWCRQFRVNFAFAELSGTFIQASGSSGAASATPAAAIQATTSPTNPTSPASQPPSQSTPAPATPQSSAGGGVLANGQFQDGAPGHQGSGSAQLQRLADGKLNLFLSNFAVTNGPDLVVVLSPDAGGSRDSVADGVVLGALKANNGNQNYAVPAGLDAAAFKSVIIYCKSFPTVFAYATLEVQR